MTRAQRLKISKGLKKMWNENKDSEKFLERNRKLSKIMKGRNVTWGDKISLACKKRGGHVGKNNPMYGKKNPKLSVLNRSRRGQPPWNKGLLGVQKGYWLGKKNPYTVRNNKKRKGKFKHSEETKRKLRESTVKHIESIGGPRMGKNEKKILDIISAKIGYKIIRQYVVSGYWVDGYIPELNIVVEVDEYRHSTIYKEADKTRENNIKKEIGCRFVRVKDDMLQDFNDVKDVILE